MRSILIAQTFLFSIYFFTTVLALAQSASKKPMVVFVTGDHEYSSEATMPIFAKELEKHYGVRVKVLKSSPDHNSEENIPGLEALKDADLAVFFLRWRRLPKEQVKYIDDYLKTGRPIIGLRTTTHAFNYPAGHPLEKWNAFGEFALGAPPGWGGKADHTHCGHLCTTDVSVLKKESKHPILTGVDSSFHVSSWLYKVLPNFPSKGSTWLLMGKAVNPDKPGFQDNPVAWTWQTSEGAKVFATTLGHPADFNVESFQRVLVNAVHWALNKPAPEKWNGKISIDVPYRTEASTK
ncbi:MAG: ThuA domain-containing protein [Chryseolinea sp.]